MILIKKNSSLECLQYAQHNGYYGSWGYENGLFSYNFSNIEKEVDSKYSYNKREEMIKSKVDGKLNLSKYEYEKQYYEIMKNKELFDNYNNSTKDIDNLTDDIEAESKMDAYLDSI